MTIMSKPWRTAVLNSTRPPSMKPPSPHTTPARPAARPPLGRHGRADAVSDAEADRAESYRVHVGPRLRHIEELPGRAQEPTAIDDQGAVRRDGLAQPVDRQPGVHRGGGPHVD